jgi:hypothetical protein
MTVKADASLRLRIGNRTMIQERSYSTFEFKLQDWKS